MNKLHREAEDLLERGGNATDARQAIVCFERAREIWRQCGERAEEGRVLLELARRYPEVKDVAKSVEASQDAAKIFKKLGRRQLQAMAIFLTASTYGFYDKSERALEFAGESLAIAREIGDKDIIELSLGVLQSVHGQLGRVKVVENNWDAAIRHAKGQLAAAKELRTLGKAFPDYGEADALLFLGIAYLKKKKPEEALVFLSEGLEIADDGKDQAKILDMLGQALESLGDHSRAIRMTQLSLEIFERSNDPAAAMVRRHLERLERAD